MINIKEKSKCSGCYACVNVCPKNCIEMVKDKEGFFYPTVRTSECVNCGLCEKVCPIISPKKVDKKIEDIVAYAAYTNNSEVRIKSSSGGIFTELATVIIEDGGYVFGSALNDKFVAEHICVSATDDLEKLRGSKYVQSAIGDSYKQAESLLKDGKTVFFTGTPCQIGGLYAYLKQDYDNLITQDIICHGVPSPLVWDSYVKYREEKSNSKTKNAYFRNKNNGWKAFGMRFEFENGDDYTQGHRTDMYMKCFLTDKCLRPSCYNCSFKTKVRASDITLADFWGINNVLPEMNDDKGISLVFLNSEKAKNLFERIKKSVTYKSTDMDAAIKYNPAAIKSTSIPVERKKFIVDVDKRGFEAAYNKHFKETLIKTIKRKIHNLKKRIFK